LEETKAISIPEKKAESNKQIRITKSEAII